MKLDAITVVNMEGEADPIHNSQEQYTSGGQQLSFEYKKAREAGLPFEVAQKIFDYGSGFAAIVNPLVASGAKSVEELHAYIKSIDCWGDGTKDSIANALADRFVK